FDSPHRRLSPVGLCTGQDRPGLRERVNLAILVGRGTEWRSIVEIRAAIPASVPAMLFGSADQQIGAGAIRSGALYVAAAFGQRCKTPQHDDQKPRHPHTLALSQHPD